MIAVLRSFIVLRNTVITRHICSEICGRAKERHPATENVKKAYVFLNPTADNGNARGNFEKFALPILNLAEFEVIMIEVRSRVRSMCTHAKIADRAARLAQSVEHQTFNLRVKGSSPLSGVFL